MKKRSLEYRDDLTYPQWMKTHKDDIKSLFVSFRDDPESALIDESTNFQAWSLDLYLGTVHAHNLAPRG